MPPRRTFLLPVVSLWLSALAHAAAPVVTVEPACPQIKFRYQGKLQEQVPLRIRYNPAGQGAALKQPSGLNLLLGGSGDSAWNGKLVRLPMTRGADGVWEASFQPEHFWIYLMFYFQDDTGRMDNNRARYWDLLGCQGGTPDDQAVSAQARTYTGTIVGSGIQRPVDYGRAVAVIEADVRAHPEHRFNLLDDLWGYKLQRDGEDERAWRKLSREIDRFLDAHAQDRMMIVAASNFVRGQKELAPAVQDKMLRLLRPFEPEYTNYRRSREWAAAVNQQDPAKQAQLCQRFIADYPGDESALSLYPFLFRARGRDLNDLPGAEEAFRAWSQAMPLDPDAYAAMAHLYTDRSQKLERAEKLLTRAGELYTGKRPEKRRGPFTAAEVGFWPERDRPWLRFLQGKLRLAQKKPQEALLDLEEAARYFKERQEVWFVLGRAQEGAGMREQAIASYLEAAAVPAQQSSDAREALDRLFGGEGSEGAARLEKLLEARLMERRAQAAAEYTPTPMERPLPDFRVTTLTGREVTSRKLRGRPAIINVWAAWCFSCMIELPGLDEFQRTHRNLTVLAVAWSSKLEDVRKIVEEKKLSAIRVAVSDALERELGDSGVPTTFVVDRKGRIRFVHNDMPDVVAILEKDLAYLAAEK